MNPLLDQRADKFCHQFHFVRLVIPSELHTLAHC